MSDLSTAVAQYLCTALYRDGSASAGLEYDGHSLILLKYTGSLCSVSAELGKLFIGMLMQILTFN